MSLNWTATVESNLSNVNYDLGQLEEMSYSGCDLSAKAHEDYAALRRRRGRLVAVAARSRRVGYLFS